MEWYYFTNFILVVSVFDSVYSRNHILLRYTDISGQENEGRPLEIVVAKDDTFELRQEVLESVLLKPEVKDKYVVVLTVVGAFRKGKSFLLNFFLRYLQTQVCA